jgi:hypothetical protein
LSYEAQNRMKIGHKGHLNTRNKFPKRFLTNPKISLPILDELEKLGFREFGRNPPNRMG